METNWDSLKATKTYRDFLKAYLSEKDLSLSDFARAAGVTRGFPGDVLSGKRRLTSTSFYSFEKALKLPLAGKKIFRLLVCQEESDVLPEVDRKKITQDLFVLKSKAWSQSRRQLEGREGQTVGRLFDDLSHLNVYAAAGEPGRGASLVELVSRTQMNEPQVLIAVSSLLRAGLLEFDDSKKTYVPKDLHLFLKDNEMASLLVRLFQKSCREASLKVQTSVKSDKEMFFTSAFCIDEKNLPELKSALRETILKFVDDSIEPSGNRIVNLMTALYL